MTRLLRDALVAAATLAILAGMAWIYLSTTTVTVLNETDQPLSDVEVGFTGKQLWKGEIGTGESKWTFGMPSQDGSVQILYTSGDTTHQVQCGYISPGPGGKAFAIEIHPDGASDCEERR